MEDEKTIELKNKISELKHRLNQMYAQYFSDTREGRTFETEFSLYVKASEYARRERSEHLHLQFDILKTGIIMLVASSALIVFLFRQYILFSTFFLLGLGFFACGFMYLILSAEIRIARADGFCSALGKYFQQYRWSTESKQNLHLPEIPLWEEYATRGDRTSFRSSRCENQALYTPFRIAISFIDLLALVFIIQSLISGDAAISRLGLAICLCIWLLIVLVHMLLVHALVNHAEIIRKAEDKDISEDAHTEKRRRAPFSWLHIPRLFFLLDIIVPKAVSTGKNNDQFPEHHAKS
jgi:hypothetical protein